MASRAHLAHRELGSIIIVIIVLVVIILFVIVIIITIIRHAHLLELPGGLCIDIPSSSSARKQRYRHYCYRLCTQICML